MRSLVILLGLTTLSLAGTTVSARMHGDDGMSERFERMDRIMDEARQSSDEHRRRRLMHRHMELMQEQMQHVRSMMHGGQDEPGYGGG